MQILQHTNLSWLSGLLRPLGLLTLLGILFLLSLTKKNVGS
uniref:Uncharacterized protein n=1 Tax=Arundo donax TaxID=35708 RepID=A0A0A9EA09_ARUDO